MKLKGNILVKTANSPELLNDDEDVDLFILRACLSVLLSQNYLKLFHFGKKGGIQDKPDIYPTGASIGDNGDECVGDCKDDDEDYDVDEYDHGGDEAYDIDECHDDDDEDDDVDECEPNLKLKAALSQLCRGNLIFPTTKSKSMIIMMMMMMTMMTMGDDKV